MSKKNKESKKNKIVIAGGGTGGHVYPALSIAQAIKKINPEIEVSFVGTKNGIEFRVIPKTEFPIYFISIGKFNRNIGLLQQLKTLFMLPFSFIQTLIVWFKIRPDVVLGVGGYASAPMVFFGYLMRKKTFIWEPNAYPGLANRLLSSCVNMSLVVFNEAQKLLICKKSQLVGIPIRDKIENKAHDLDKDSKMSLSEERVLNVLIFGGSQGARGINNVVVEALKEAKPWHNQFHFIHQIGSTDFEKVKKIYEESKNPQRQYLEFIHDMEDKYEWADVVVCRSGASTIAELMALGKPSILIPFPHASDDHQLKNAQVLSEKKSCVLIEQKNFTQESFKKKLLKLKEDPSLRESLSKNLRMQFIPNSAKKIAEILLEN